MMNFSTTKHNQVKEDTNQKHQENEVWSNVGRNENCIVPEALNQT